MQLFFECLSPSMKSLIENAHVLLIHFPVQHPESLDLFVEVILGMFW
jgi:hypothetical protein